MQAIAFAPLYGRGAGSYDRFTDWLFLGEWSRWQDTVSVYLPEIGTVLELGSGTGGLASRSRSRTRRWIEIEPSAAMIHHSRERFTGPERALIRASAFKLPLGNHTVDAIVATFPTEFILEQACAEEIRRVLVPEGQLVVVLTGWLTGKGWRYTWRRKALSLFYGHSEHPDTGKIGRDLVAALGGNVAEVQTSNGAAAVLVARIS